MLFFRILHCLSREYIYICIKIQFIILAIIIKENMNTEIQAWWVGYLLIWFALILTGVINYSMMLRSQIKAIKIQNINHHDTIQAPSIPSAKLLFIDFLNGTRRSLTEEDWSMLAQEINSKNPQFTKKLLDKYILSDIEYHVCLLLKIGFTPIQISKIICRSKENVTSIRRRLSQKAQLSSTPSPKDWDKFIQEL